jgi:O-antigen/teichoic acid export membrane protein
MGIASNDSPLKGPKSVSIRLNFAWTFAGNLVNAGSQWALIVILAKQTSPEAVGQFAFALALTTPVMLFASLKLRSAQATDQRHEYKFSEYWSLRLLTTFMALLVILFLGFASHPGQGMIWVISLVGFAKGIESLSDILYGLFQKHERMDLIARSMILRGVVTIGIAFGVLFVTTSVVAIAACLLVSWTLVMVGYDLPRARKIAMAVGDSFQLLPTWANPRLGQLIYLTLPLGASIAIGCLYLNIPRLVIENRLGVHELGIFSALAYFMLFGGMIFTALGHSVVPRLARYFVEGNYSGFRRIFFKLIGIGVILGLVGVIVAILFGEALIGLFYTNQYAKYSWLLVLLMVASLIEMTFGSIAGAVNAMRIFRVQIVISSVSALVILGSSLSLVGSAGLSGVAMAMIITKGVEALMYVVVLYKYLPQVFTGNSKFHS